MDYFQAEVRAPYEAVVRGLVVNFGDAKPLPQKGFHGYGVGLAIPTAARGTLTVNPAGTHDWPSVRVSGWPSEAVAAYLRERWEGQASRVDAAVDFAGDLAPWCEALTQLARMGGLKWGTYHVGMRSTGVELGAGKSESRTRCYDAALKHPGEFSGPTGRLEHEWKPGQKERKELAYLVDAGTVLGASRPARMVLDQLVGMALPSVPPRTARVSDLDRWLAWFQVTGAQRLGELLERNGGDMVATMRELLGDNDSA